MRCGTKANFTAGPRVSDANRVACYGWRDQAFVSTRTCWHNRKLDYDEMARKGAEKAPVGPESNIGVTLKNIKA